MDDAVIRKPAIEEFGVRPNLVEFERRGEASVWEGIQKELDWLPGGFLNKAHECIDRHVDGGRGDKPAMLWEGKKGETEVYSFSRLKEETNRFANVLKSLGVNKGDRVFFFMERVPELYIGVFGALKAGAVAGPLFSAFGPEPVKERMLDSGAKILVRGRSPKYSATCRTSRRCWSSTRTSVTPILWPRAT
jgi:acetyl-CoA synthetase